MSTKTAIGTSLEAAVSAGQHRRGTDRYQRAKGKPGSKEHCSLLEGQVLFRSSGRTTSILVIL